MRSNMKINKKSDENIIDDFTESFGVQVARNNNIDEFEATVSRSMGDKEVEIEVMITGLAGSPISETFKNDKLEDAREVCIKKQDGELFFKLVPEETTILNTNDYIIKYKMV